MINCSCAEAERWLHSSILTNWSKFNVELSGEAITMPWCGSHYSTPINEPFRPIRSRVVKSPKVGDCFVQQTLFFPTQYKRKKAVWLRETTTGWTLCGLPEDPSCTTESSCELLADNAYYLITLRINFTQQISTFVSQAISNARYFNSDANSITAPIPLSQCGGDQVNICDWILENQALFHVWIK